MNGKPSRASRHCALFCALFRALPCALLFTGLTAAAQVPPPTQDTARPPIFVYPDVAPTGFLNAQDKPDGYFFKLVKSALMNAGFERHILRVYPIPRIYESLNDGSADITFNFASNTLSNCCVVGKWVVLPDELRVYYLSSSLPIKVKEDLIGKSIIKIAGYTYSGVVDYLVDGKEGTKFEFAPALNSGVEMLVSKRAQYLVGYARPTGQAIANNGATNIVFTTLRQLGYVTAVSKRTPNAERLLEQLEQQFKKLQSEPDYAPPKM